MSSYDLSSATLAEIINSPELRGAAQGLDDVDDIRGITYHDDLAPGEIDAGIDNDF